MYHNADEIRGIIADFKKLATKIQQDNEAVKKTLIKERETILSTCQKEYKKLCYTHEALKKKYSDLEQKLEQQWKKQQKQTSVHNYATPKVQRFKKAARKHYYIVDDEEDEADDEQTKEDEGEGITEEGHG